MLAQKKSGPSSKTINEATRLFSGLVDLDFEPGYGDHVYFQHLLASNNGDIVLCLRKKIKKYIKSLQ